MTNITATTPTAVTDLVRSGEALYESLTAREMSEGQQKVADACCLFIDGVLPAIESRVSFDLGGVILGVTKTLNGIAGTIDAAKTDAANDNVAPGASGIA